MPDNPTAAKDVVRAGGKNRSLRRRRKRFIPSLVLRFAMSTILLAGTSVVCWTAVTNISRPYVLGAQQSEEIAQKTSALQSLNADSARLERQCAYLNRPDGIENEARMKGYLKPGEQSLVITTPTNSGQ